MNILPKKRWHVRTKENIARVRADEAKFDAEKLRAETKSLLAEQEARVDLLRQRKKNQLNSVSSQLELVQPNAEKLNFDQGNREYEVEKKIEQEKKEKAIGLLTYLGQSVLDSGGEKPWYDVHPRTQTKIDEEKRKKREEWDAKKKAKDDPLNDMKRIEEVFRQKKEIIAREKSRELQSASNCIKAMPSLFPNDILVPKSSSITVKCPKSFVNEDVESSAGLNTESSGSSAKHSDSMDGDSQIPARSNELSDAIQMAKKMELDRLRAERLQRERKERERAAVLMAKAMGLHDVLKPPEENPVDTDERNLPFNSAYNPELSAVLAERRRKYRESKKRRYEST